MEELINHYSNYDEDKRLSKQLVTRIEFDTTKHILSKYLNRNKSIIELGAATGKYAFHYAALGHKVTAVEIVPEYVRLMHENAKEKNLELNIFEGNAISVPFIESGSQDIVLILGPLYHLKNIEDRQSVMNEAKRILKPNGKVAIAYINKFFVAGMFVQRFPELIDKKILDELIEKGTVSSGKADTFCKMGYFSSPDEMEQLITSNGFSIQEHVAADGFGRFISEEINSLNDKQYKIWLDYHFKTCHEKSLLGISSHGLVIGAKK